MPDEMSYSIYSLPQLVVQPEQVSSEPAPTPRATTQDRDTSPGNVGRLANLSTAQLCPVMAPEFGNSSSTLKLLRSMEKGPVAVHNTVHQAMLTSRILASDHASSFARVLLGTSSDFGIRESPLTKMPNARHLPGQPVRPLHYTFGVMRQKKHSG